MADHLRTELVLDALGMAVWNRRPTRSLPAHDYQRVLLEVECEADLLLGDRERDGDRLWGVVVRRAYADVLYLLALGNDDLDGEAGRHDRELAVYAWQIGELHN